jgi:DNA polymerase-3 subunit gamma/tau
VAHGYIFSGARGVGKTSTARILAKSLNCAQGPTVTPCGQCPSCVEIAAGNSVDVFEIDAASNRGIDEIRELRETVRYLPARDRYKVFIIDEVHMLTTEAFNALLKTLEEPPPRALFLLATTEPHKLPATIQSRCQHFAFRLLDYAEIYARLEMVCAAEKVRADEGALSAIAQAAEGSLRDALSLLDQVIAARGEHLEENRVRQLLGVVPVRFLREMVEAVHAGDTRLVLERVGELAREGYELAHFATEFTRYIRSLMIAKSCGAESPLLQVPADERGTLAELAKLFSEEDLTRFFQILLRLESELRYSLAPRFHMEMGLLKLVHAGKLASLESLLGDLRGAKLVGKQAAPPPRPSSPSPLPRGGMKAGEFEAPQQPPSSRKSAGQPPPPAVAMGEGTTSHPEDPRLEAIKSLLYDQSKKFLSSCLEHVSGWRFENGEVRFLCPKGESWVADFLRSREQQEALRSVCAQVLGQPIKIYVTLDEAKGQSATARPEARERAGNDAAVEAFRKRLDCTWVGVKDLSQG